MQSGLLRDLLTLAAGGMTGVLSAAFGVGGAVVSTPALRALGLGAELAIGSTLPSILPSAVSGTLRYSRERLVDWRVVAYTVPAGFAASIGGSVLAHSLPGEGHLLMVLTALLLLFSAYRMSAHAREPTTEEVAEMAGAADLVDTVEPDANAAERRDDEVADEEPGRPATLVGVGLVAGFLSGLLGIGGGVVMVPGFTELARIRLKTAIASSLVCVGIFAIPGTITHAALGGIRWWPWAILLTLGVVPGARIGAALTIRAADTRLRRTVAYFLGAVALAYLVGEIASLVAA